MSSQYGMNPDKWNTVRILNDHFSRVTNIKAGPIVATRRGAQVEVAYRGGKFIAHASSIRTLKKLIRTLSAWHFNAIRPIDSIRRQRGKITFFY